MMQENIRSNHQRMCCALSTLDEQFQHEISSRASTPLGDDNSSGKRSPSGPRPAFVGKEIARDIPTMGTLGASKVCPRETLRDPMRNKMFAIDRMILLTSSTGSRVYCRPWTRRAKSLCVAKATNQIYTAGKHKGTNPCAYTQSHPRTSYNNPSTSE